VPYICALVVPAAAAMQVAVALGLLQLMGPLMQCLISNCAQLLAQPLTRQLHDLIDFSSCATHFDALKELITLTLSMPKWPLVALFFCVLAICRQ
jgi:hypothetical protein